MTPRVKSRYCDACDENWPDALAYHKCPGCSAVTVTVEGLEPMTGPVAFDRAADLTLSRQRREEFERFCAERDAPMIEAAVADLRAELEKGLPA